MRVHRAGAIRDDCGE